MDHVPNIRRETLIPMTSPLEGVFADPGAVLEMEEGDTFSEIYEYMDGHVEEGMARYTGQVHRANVNGCEFITLPVLEPVTPLSQGLVHIVMRRKM